MTSVRIAFERQALILPISSLLPQKPLSDSIRKTSKYKRISKSIAEIGLVEPVVVCRTGKRSADGYLVLDGHVRLAALTELGQSDVPCVLSDDDEAFTYNKRVARLATVQEHLMLLRALKRGVSEERLARTLNVDIKLIKRRRTLLDGICPEAVELLKDKSINPVTFDTLRKMKPLRQISVADLMITANNFSASYAKALLIATQPSDLVRPDKTKKVNGLSPEQIAKMERELEALQQDFKNVESTYGDDVLHLVIAAAYLAKLLGNPEIERFLRRKHPEILQEFRAIIAAASLDQGTMTAA